MQLPDVDSSEEHVAIAAIAESNLATGDYVASRGHALTAEGLFGTDDQEWDRLGDVEANAVCARERRTHIL